MLGLKLERMIKEDEEVVRIVRKYALVFCWPLLVSAFFIIAPFFFLYPLFHWGGWGVVGFGACVGIGLLLALRVFVLYTFNTFVITDQRIIDVDQRGFFDRTVSETTYDKIQDVSLRIKGIAQTLLHYGSVIIQTAGSTANIELTEVKNPEHIQQIIIQLQRESAIPAKPEPAARQQD